MNIEPRMKVGLVLLVILIAFCWCFIDFQQQAIREAMESMGEDGSMKPEQLQSEAQKIDQYWLEAIMAMKRHDREKASAAVGKVRYFDNALTGVQTHEFSPALTYQKWWERHRQNFRKATLEECQKVISESIADPRKSFQIAEFLTHFQDLVPEIKKGFEDRRQEVQAARLRAARNWFRIAINADEQGFHSLVRDRFAKQWCPVFGKELFPGEAMDERERDAT